MKAVLTLHFLQIIFPKVCEILVLRFAASRRVHHLVFTDVQLILMHLKNSRAMRISSLFPLKQTVIQ